MKQIFRLLAVAIFTMILTIACSKEAEDDPIVDDTTGATENSEDNIPDNTVIVTFGDEEWTAGKYIGALQMVEGDSIIQILAQRDADADLDQTQTARIGFYPSLGEHVANASFESNAIQDPQYDNENIIVCDFFDNDYLTNLSGTLYGNWWGKKVEWNVIMFDATSLKMQVQLEANMFDAASVMVDGTEFDAAMVRMMRVDANIILENR